MRLNRWAAPGGLAILLLVALWPAEKAQAGRLFPLEQPEAEWAEFSAQGFSKPVAGVIFRADKPACCGMPLGGISTGCLDLETWGVWGFSTIFSPGLKAEVRQTVDRPEPWFLSPFYKEPRSPKLYTPSLGLTAGDRTWVLASKQVKLGGMFPDTCEDTAQRLAPVIVQGIEGVGCAREIHYWGHYPVVDVEYETDAPVQVGLRAWSPFIPGDVALSNTPGAVFDVQLRNLGQRRQQGQLIFSFPGPTQAEAQFTPEAPRTMRWHVGQFGVRIPTAEKPVEARREAREENGLRLLTVAAPGGTNYALGVDGGWQAEFGGALGVKDWKKAPRGLPRPAATDFGASVAVTFDLAPGGETSVPIILSWYQPIWFGDREDQIFTQMYASRYQDAAEVARLLARDRAGLLRRILAWQEVIYGESGLPGWLKDSLINSLSTITESSFWSMGKDRLGWCGSEGYFMMVESMRRAFAPGTIPCDFYGNLPLVFFYQDLAANTLKYYALSVRENGMSPLALDLEGRGGGHELHQALNGVCLVTLLDRLWQRTGDDAILKKYYDQAKRTTRFMVTLSPGPEGIISVQPGKDIAGWAGPMPGRDWFESYPFFGMTAHVGWLHLAALRIAERMAQQMGDGEFARQCREWFQQGYQAMEKHLWNGRYYRNYKDLESGQTSDILMASQVDGEWLGRFHGHQVLPDTRVGEVLQAIKDLCLDPVLGAWAFVEPDGQPNMPVVENWYRTAVSYAIFPPETMMVGMAFLYGGDRETGLKILRGTQYNVVCRQRYPWDLPNTVVPYSGKRAFGTEYYQNLMLWAAPAALRREDLKATCAAGGLVNRILQAAK
ncbi:MAG: hypothetical protein HY717_20860 [Planctomycetes bacterium]|nr:hypothetical protein [Planctomycetota bacterium]